MCSDDEAFVKEGTITISDPPIQRYNNSSVPALHYTLFDMFNVRDVTFVVRQQLAATEYFKEWFSQRDVRESKTNGKYV